MDRFFFIAGSISAFLGVALGAFAAHGLKTKLTRRGRGLARVIAFASLFVSYGTA